MEKVECPRIFRGIYSTYSNIRRSLTQPRCLSVPDYTLYAIIACSASTVEGSLFLSETSSSAFGWMCYRPLTA